MINLVNGFFLTFVTLIVISLLVIIVRFNRQLEYGFWQTAKSVSISLFITILAQFALIILFGFFFVIPAICKKEVYCISMIKTSLAISPYTAPVIFLIVLFEYYLTRVVKMSK